MTNYGQEEGLSGTLEGSRSESPRPSTPLERLKYSDPTLYTKIHQEPVKYIQEQVRIAVDRDSSRLGAIIENHIDDMTWVLERIGITEPSRYWRDGCRIDRKRLEAWLETLDRDAAQSHD